MYHVEELIIFLLIIHLGKDQWYQISTHSVSADTLVWVSESVLGGGKVGSEVEELLQFLKFS